MSTPNPTPTLEERVQALEVRVVAEAQSVGRKVDAFFWTVLSHARNISYIAVTASITAFVLKLYHQIGL